jgi:hypothetical protein
MNFFRSQGIEPTTQIYRYPDGSVRAVAVTITNPTTGQPLEGEFFTSEVDCENYRTFLMRQNLVADPDELK